MGIFNFWKKKEISEKTKVGRHQQVLLINKFLGQAFNGSMLKLVETL